MQQLIHNTNINLHGAAVHPASEIIIIIIIRQFLTSCITWRPLQGHIKKHEIFCNA